jgi:hypothetical protein
VKAAILMVIALDKIHMELVSWTWKNWVLSQVLFGQLEKRKWKKIHQGKW